MTAARPDYPASTNVSSPVQAASRRRNVRANFSNTSADLHGNGYARDGMVVSDGDEDFHGSNDDSDSGFEPVRQAGKSRSPRKKQLGPPITTDEKLSDLNPIHQDVVEDFLDRAKEQSKKV